MGSAGTASLAITTGAAGSGRGETLVEALFRAGEAAGSVSVVCATVTARVDGVELGATGVLSLSGRRSGASARSADGQIAPIARPRQERS
ncbi:MAG TPA: hypothetical protein VNI55_01705 [Gaiellaceae bacterium]|nr:hypothetical protein [Gaiellaceae bacterium]